MTETRAPLSLLLDPTMLYFSLNYQKNTIYMLISLAAFFLMFTHIPFVTRIATTLFYTDLGLLLLHFLCSKKASQKPDNILAFKWKFISIKLKVIPLELP
ncbi:hypothetical protein [Swingsia samuiensis]|uniref:Uncharacterized protein n=1 Tax=Swingsia samuiensis TaxID=1293412 RepID=A0A4Y6UIF1_9PROT|nr:hypothetical protein [Swingsia samuiensis]QDH17363.1 hypothetical protein E3D00_07165 [Swingsia samuiensis]